MRLIAQEDYFTESISSMLLVLREAWVPQWQNTTCYNPLELKYWYWTGNKLRQLQYNKTRETYCSNTQKQNTWVSQAKVLQTILLPPNTLTRCLCYEMNSLDKQIHTYKNVSKKQCDKDYCTFGAVSMNVTLFKLHEFHLTEWHCP